MRRFFHWFYVLLGHAICRLFLIYWIVRDYMCPPQSEAILFVAHPDDDTLFFHTFIKKYKPYVVLCTTGWSLRRLPCFIRAMHYYGVRYRAYDLGSRDTRMELLERQIKSSLAIGNFKIVATHNAAGEYGHEMHRRVHQVVIQNSRVPVLAPMLANEIANYTLDKDIIEDKKRIFNSIYTTEKWVLEQYALWVNNEKLVKV